MAVLNCTLCGQPAEQPVWAGRHVFCCHGCRTLWSVVGEEGIAQLRAGPRPVAWDVVREAAQAPAAAGEEAGGEGRARVRTASLALAGLWCASCGVLLEHVLARQSGVLGVRVDFAASRAEVAFDEAQTSLERIDARVRQLGYGAKEREEEAGADPDLLRRFGAAALISALVMMFSVPVWSGYLSLLPLGLRWALVAALGLGATAVIFWAGWPLLRGAWQALRHGTPTMDLLVAVGSLAAYAYSVAAVLWRGPFLYFDTGCMIITFILLARNLEVAARSEAARLLRLLSGLAARDAVVLRDDGEVPVPVEGVRVGETVVIRPGQRVPLDGRVRGGESAVDESLLTGEPLPVAKGPGDAVYAGTINGFGRLLVEVIRPAADSVLGQTVAAMREAQRRKGRWQVLADRWVRIFVPAVLLAAALTFVLWWHMADLAVGPALLRAIAVLVIACPCALAVATPLAVLAGAQRLGRHGVLLRSGDALERAAAVDAVLLDKTGTLTVGAMRLEELCPAPGWAEEELLRLAAAVEAASEHPIAAAVMQAAHGRTLALPPVEAFRARAGLGVEGQVEGHWVQVGARAGTAGLGPLADRATAWEAAGRTVLAVTVDGQPAGLLALGDRVRPEAAAAVQRLQRLGLQLGVVSGDGPGAVAALAQAVGIPAWWARRQPAEKAELVQQHQAAGRRVAFVGDGVNDAVALVQADLGVALASGADIAVEAGQLTLVRPDLQALADILATARQTVGIIRVNLLWSVLYNLAALPVAAAGLASPVLAAAAMVCSSALVLGNTLRLLGSAPWRLVRGAALVAAAGALLGVMAWRGL